MKCTLFLATIALFLSVNSFGQAKVSTDVLDLLIGEWRGQGQGQPGSGEGSCSFSRELGGSVIVRKNITAFQSTGGEAGLVHEDLLVIYNLKGTGGAKAFYVDSEGNSINYSLSVEKASIVLTGERLGSMPVFRLTHELLDGDTMRTAFETSTDGISFTVHVEGVTKRVKRP